MQNLPVNTIIASIFMLLLAGCQGTDKFVEVADDINATLTGARFDPTQQQNANQTPDPDRAAAVADIRQKAASSVATQGEFPKVFDVKESVATELNAADEEKRISDSVGTAVSPASQYAASVNELDGRAEALRKKADTHYGDAEAEILRKQAQQQADREKAEGSQNSETETAQ